MALVDSAVNGLAGALVSGGIALGVFWLSNRRKKSRLDEAWRTQANALSKALSAQYEGQVTWLRGQWEKCQSECTRLNKLLTRRGDDQR